MNSRCIRLVCEAAAILVESIILFSLATRTAMAVNILYGIVTGPCGDVTANGGFNGLTGVPSWDWGDGTRFLSMFPGTHTYKKNGTYTITITAPTANGFVTGTGSVEINNVDSGCSMSVTASPEIISLRDGLTSARISVQLWDSDGNRVPLGDRTVTFSSSTDQLISVDSAGTVSSSRFGRGDVTVTVSGVTRGAIVHVYAGHLRIEPPIPH